MPLTPQERDDLISTGLDDGTSEGAMMSCLAAVPDLIRRGRTAKSSRHNQSRLPSATADNVIRDLRALDARFTTILDTPRERYHTSPMPAPLVALIGTEGALSLHLRTYALGLATEIVILILRCAIEVATETAAVLDQRLERASCEMIGLADEAARWLPLGAMSMVACVGIAWVGARGEEVGGTRDALWLRWIAYGRVISRREGAGDEEGLGGAHLERVRRRLALE